jgi:hypothetical protein
MKPTNQALSINEVAEQFSELHVQHELNNFNTDTFMLWLKEDLEQLMSWLKEQKLEDLVSSDQVKATIRDTVVEHKIPGAVTEIAGETALQHFNSEWHLNAQLKDIMSTRQFEGFLNKLLELENQRNKLINQVIDLPVYQELISGALYGAITRYVYDSNLLSKNIPGVSSMLKMGRSVVNKTVPQLGGAVEENIRNFIENNLDLVKKESKTFLIQAMADDSMQTSIMDFWDAFENNTLSELQEGMDALDLADLVVLGYEFWLSFRKTQYFRESYEAIVDYWFEKYGSTPLSELFEDLDLTSDIFLREAQRYAPRALKKLKDSGQLESLIRRRLSGFYQSEASLEYLGQITHSSGQSAD